MGQLATGSQELAPTGGGGIPSLSGLPGQDALQRLLALLLKRSQHKPLAVTLGLLQLDNFYAIRQWIGEAEAEMFLARLVILAQAQLPTSCLIYRCRRYEFALVLFNEASLHAQRLSAELVRVLGEGAREALPTHLQFRCAVGLAKLVADMGTPGALFARARQSLRHSHGKPALPRPDSTALTTAVLAAVRQALQEKALRMHYQPLVDLRGDHPPVHVLSTRLPPGGPPLRSGHLFEIATAQALGEPIDRQVIAAALRRWREAPDPRQHLVVKLTPNSMVSRPFLRWLADLGERHPEPIRHLGLQLHEIDVLTCQHHLPGLTGLAQALGIRLIIGHFGTTPEPLRYLSLLPAFAVDLDVSLHKKLYEHPKCQARLQSMTQQLHELDLKVIASKVARLDRLPALWHAGVDFVRGPGILRDDPRLSYAFMRTLTAGTGR